MKLIFWSLQTYQNMQNHKGQLRGVGHSTSVRTKIPDNSEQDHEPQNRHLRVGILWRQDTPFFHFSKWGEIKLRKAELMSQMCSLLVAEMQYKFLGTLTGNPPLLRRVVMECQAIYHSWKHFKIHLSRKFSEMYDGRFHFILWLTSQMLTPQPPTLF